MIDRQRLDCEREDMKRRYPLFELKTKILGTYRGYSWDGKVQPQKRVYSVRVVYSNAYPNSRPYVFILNDAGESVKINTSHIDTKYNLCLYTSDGSENDWNRNYTVADVVDRLIDFIILFEKDKHKDIHRTVKDPCIDLTNSRKYVINADWAPDISGTQGVITFEKLKTNDNFYFAVTIEDSEKNTIVSIENEFMNSQEKADNEKIKWIYLKRVNRSEIFNIRKISDFVDFISRKESSKGFYNVGESKYIIYCGYNKEPILIELSNKNINVSTGKVEFSNIIKIEPESFFARNKGIIDVDELEKKRVTIFGVGSLGSIIIEQLCRAGVGNINLFDYDVFLPNNISRHTLTLEELFINKADAIKKRIQAINPYAMINSYGFLGNPFYHDELYSILEDVFIQSDIIICATGDEECEHEVNYLLKSISAKKAVPTLFAAVLGNGFGGRFHKVIFDTTPCYECIKLLQRSNPEAYKLYNEDIYMQTNEGILGTYSQPGIPGLYADINFVASLSVKMALEILLPNKRPFFNHNSYIWANKPGWIFENGYQLKEVVFNRVSNCPICGVGG